MPSVLIVTRSYPPRNLAGAHRLGCFAKYLDRLGWDVQVMRCFGNLETSDPRYDANLMPEVHNYVKWTVNYKRRLMAKELTRPRYWKPGIGAELVKLLKCLPVDFLLPHRHPNALFAAVRESTRNAVAKERPDIIFSSAPPSIVNLATASTAAEFRIPHVIDYRDTFEQFNYGRRKRLLLARAEREAAGNAAAITCVTHDMAALLESRLHRDCFVVPNGFDHEAHLRIPKVETFPKFSITFTGTFSNLYLTQRGNLPLLFEALDLLFSRGEIDCEDVEINFAGHIHQPAVHRMISPFRSRKRARFLGHMNHPDALSLQSHSAVLLQLADATQKGVMPMKTFEYLAAGRPILSIPRDHSCVDELLKRTRGGYPCDDLSSMVEILRAWHQEWKATGQIKFEGVESEIGKYRRENLSLQLSTILVDSLKNEGRVNSNLSGGRLTQPAA